MANFDQRGQKVNTQYNADKIEINQPIENQKGSKYAIQTCALCKGKGRRGFSTEPCESCKGKGSVFVLQPPQQCPYCKGKGLLGLSTTICPTCNGSGWAHTIND